MAADNTIYTHFRCENSDGSSKDWAIGLTDDGLRIRYCATNQTARLSDIAGSKLAGTSPQEEMWKRIQKKRSDGYVEIGEARIEKGRLVETKPVEEVHLHWEAAARISNDDLAIKVSSILESLSNCEVNATVSPCENADGLRVVMPHGEWDFGFQPNGGLQSDGRGGGKVSRRLGPLPVLILMALDRGFPNTLRFADDLSDDVKLVISEDDQFLGRAAGATPQQVTTIGAALGLCLGPLRLADTLKDSQDRSLWF